MELWISDVEVFVEYVCKFVDFQFSAPSHTSPTHHIVGIFEIIQSNFTWKETVEIPMWRSSLIEHFIRLKDPFEKFHLIEFRSKCSWCYSKLLKIAPRYFLKSRPLMHLTWSALSNFVRIEKEIKNNKEDFYRHKYLPQRKYNDGNVQCGEKPDSSSHITLFHLRR